MEKEIKGKKKQGRQQKRLYPAITGIKPCILLVPEVGVEPT